MLKLLSILLIFSGSVFASTSCNKLEQDSRYAHFLKFVDDFQLRSRMWSNYDIKKNPLYLSLAPYNDCFFFLLNGKVEKILLAKKYELDSNPDDSYAQIYTFLGTKFPFDESPQELIAHYQRRSIPKALLLVLPSDYPSHPKRLRTVAHEAFHWLVQKNEDGRIATGPNFSREEMETCYEKMTLEESNAMIELAEAAFKKDRRAASKSFSLYYKLRSERGQRTLTESTFPNKTWACADIEDQMEKIEGITEFATWQSLFNMPLYGYTSEMFLTLLTREFITLPTRDQSYYLTGATLMFALEAFDLPRLMRNRALWTLNNGENGPRIIDELGLAL